MWTTSSLAFVYVLASLWTMASSAWRVKDLAGTEEAFKLHSLSLRMILVAILSSWLLFPLVILCFNVNLLSVAQSEWLLQRANFCSKVRVHVKQAILACICTSQTRHICPCLMQPQTIIQKDGCMSQSEVEGVHLTYGPCNCKSNWVGQHLSEAFANA